MNRSKISLLLLTIILSVSLTSCSLFSEEEEGQSFPVTNEKSRDAERGKITGKDGIVLFGGKSKKDLGRGETVTSGVNAYLWQASLDVISFMPIANVDATGGVIITDWYEDPAVRGERLKANIVISSAELRASGIKVSLFRQISERGGGWVNASGNRELARKLEDRILTRAREIKIENNRL